MFSGNFRESTEKQEEIKDISADTFEEFLHFLYSGNLRNPNVDAEDLIIVADRYQVKDLMKVCETKLLKNINNGNAEAIYRLASKIQCNAELKKVSFELLQT